MTNYPHIPEDTNMTKEEMKNRWENDVKGGKNAP